MLRNPVLRASCSKGRWARLAQQQSTTTLSPRSVTVRAASSCRQVLQQTLTDAAHQANPLVAAFLQQSMSLYMDRTPAVDATLDALSATGGIAPTMWHDHFAYRTLGLPGLGIASMAPVLEELGYAMREDGLQFKAKKLTAAWFAHTATCRATPCLPRIFVSEIKVHELSNEAQDIIHKYATGLHLGPAHVTTACCTGALPWGPITQHEYNTLLKESDYAAWVMVHGYALNHTALSVHTMRGRGEGGHVNIQEAANLLQQAGLTLNPDGGLIKVSPDGLLQQCSTMSDHVGCAMRTDTGTKTIQVPGSYVELVERLVLPDFKDVKVDVLQEWQRRDGFEVSNASHLFTSTRA